MSSSALYMQIWRSRNPSRSHEINSRSRRKNYKKWAPKINKARRSLYSRTKDTVDVPKRRAKQQQGITENPERYMLNVVRARAKRLGLEFNLVVADIHIPLECPVLKIPLYRGKGASCANSPSIDRINNQQGYIQGNIIVVSHRANTIKNCASVDELKKVTEFYTRISEEK